MDNGKNTSENEIKLEAERILKEYAYLDNLDELNGWAWEFLRRTQEYKDFCEKAKTVKIAFEDNKANDNEVCQTSRLTLFLEGFNFFDGEIPFDIYYTFNTTGLLELKKDERPGFISIHRYVKDKPIWETWMIPRYDTPYNRFNDFEGNKPKLKGAFPFKLLSHKQRGLVDVSETEKSTELYSPAIDQLELDNLPPGSMKFTLIIKSKEIKSRDIEIDLVSQIKKQIQHEKALQEATAHEPGANKKPRPRSDKWKYYLITYDLIEIVKLDIDRILKIFNQFPRKIKMDPYDLDHYHSKGMKLIEKGKYKEYLYF